MLDVKCRLCSSNSALISLFNGKCRRNRDYIRKLVEVTTGIKFQKEDTFNCICYPCTVQVYNFYIFKTRSVENEAILESHIDKLKKSKPNKFEILGLDDIVLPKVEELQGVLVPWLEDKRKYCETIDTNQDGVANQNSISNGNCNTNNRDTRIDTLQTSDFSVQCCLSKITSHKGVQSKPDISHKAIQSDAKNMSHKCLQSDLLNHTINKYTQCIIPQTETCTQTNCIITKCSKTQCYLLPNNVREKPNLRNRDSSTQISSISLEKSTQYNICGENCTRTDCKCHLLLDIKQELVPLSPLLLSPLQGLDVGVIPNKSKTHVSPIPPCISPMSSNLLTVRNRSHSVIICQICDQAFYSKPSYKLHRKSHMVCNFCKKKFISVKRTKWHLQYDCEVKKLLNVEPVVRLMRLERLKNVREKYPQCFKDPSDIEIKSRTSVRMRSRSTSSLDSFYSSYKCWGPCKNAISLLQRLKLGVDKSVQVNFFYDSPAKSCLTNTPKSESGSERKFGNREDITLPAKKRKLFHSFKE
ncbi:hypothetical protein NQ315_007297 [Exocentrus adspersus]|uniref:ZAD domain-containing protein n=1 Tax=Exocentrus adspersus TaxID=1586481 RepID=A0AAV8WEK3_9CUCU|nr:hypothetical protein NQ315_007297 [Exocentrus adspersus]